MCSIGRGKKILRCNVHCTCTNKELWGESRCRMEHKMLESILLQSSPQAAFTHNASHALMEGGKLSTYNSAWLLFSTCPKNVIIGSKNVKASSHYPANKGPYLMMGTTTQEAHIWLCICGLDSILSIQVWSLEKWSTNLEQYYWTVSRPLSKISICHCFRIKSGQFDSTFKPLTPNCMPLISVN